MCATVTLTSGGKASSKTEESEQDVCWLCLDGDSAGSALAAPCACRSMKAHQPCLARWQLTQAGKRQAFARSTPCSPPSPSRLPTASPPRLPAERSDTAAFARQSCPTGATRLPAFLWRGP